MAMKMLHPGGHRMRHHHSVRFTNDELPKYKSSDSPESSLQNFAGPSSHQSQDSGDPSPDNTFTPAVQRFRVNEQRIKLLTAINQVVQQRAELESNRTTLTSQLEELKKKLKRRIEECHHEKKEKMKSLKQANQKLEKEKVGLICDIEHLKRHLEKEEAHHVQHARTVVAQKQLTWAHEEIVFRLKFYSAYLRIKPCTRTRFTSQAIQGVTKLSPSEHLFTPCSVIDLPNIVCRNVAKNAPSRVADNKLAAARLMREIAELRQRVAQVEARLANELKRKRQAEADISRLRKELSTTKSCMASLRMPSYSTGKCSKFI